MPIYSTDTDNASFSKHEAKKGNIEQTQKTKRIQISTKEVSFK